MKIQLELSDEETSLLQRHLARYVEHLDQELVRTDQHDLQHKLAAEISTLRRIVVRLAAKLAA